MNKIISIDEIRRIVEDEGLLSLGLVSKEYMLRWIHPKDITGLNAEEIKRANRSRYWSAWFPSIGYAHEFNDDYVGPDDIVFDYLREVVTQRYALREEYEDVELISPSVYLEALMYMALNYESHVNFTDVDRSKASYSDLQRCVSIFEDAIIKASAPYIKLDLRDVAYFFFCYQYVSPELSRYEELQRFLSNNENIEALDRLSVEAESKAK